MFFCTSWNWTVKWCVCLCCARWHDLYKGWATGILEISQQEDLETETQLRYRENLFFWKKFLKVITFPLIQHSISEKLTLAYNIEKWIIYWPYFWTEVTLSEIHTNSRTHFERQKCSLVVPKIQKACSLVEVAFSFPHSHWKIIFSYVSFILLRFVFFYIRLDKNIFVHPTEDNFCFAVTPFLL